MTFSPKLRWLRWLAWLQCCGQRGWVNGWVELDCLFLSISERNGAEYCKTSCNATGLISNTTLQPGYKSRINSCKKCGGVMK
ncbi:hypothetical protein HN51_062087, partial [Arachis hypogaea]